MPTFVEFHDPNVDPVQSYYKCCLDSVEVLVSLQLLVNNTQRMHICAESMERISDSMNTVYVLIRSCISLSSVIQSFRAIWPHLILNKCSWMCALKKIYNNMYGTLKCENLLPLYQYTINGFDLYTTICCCCLVCSFLFHRVSSSMVSIRFGVN